MNAFTTNASLVIHPGDPEWVPAELSSVIDFLQGIGLVAAALPGEAQSFTAGDNFLKLVTFMGCSPSIRFSPGEENDSFSFIRLRSTPGAITTLTSRHSHAPHCPHCNKAEKNWRDRLDSSDPATGLACSSCGETSPPWLYNWRKSAGFASFFIEITDIYPKEAIPQESLLSELENLGNGSWKYFYHYP